jgi:cellulose synthase operon protein C
MRTKPDDAQFWFHLSSASIAAKQYDRAEVQLGEVLRVAPDSAPALNNLAWVLVTQRKPGALELARRANELAPNQPVFMDTLSLALAAGGSPKDAVASQRRALALNPEAHELRLNLVRFLLQAGERAEAAKELDQLAKLGEKFAGQDRVRELRAQLEAR